MSRQTNKPRSDQELRDLLDKTKNAGLPADDFEKDALEGFAMLESEQEAFDLKARLDERIHNGVLQDEKKSRKKYWLAAACFMLIVGLSVYFTWRSSGISRHDLAVTNPVVHEEEKVIAPAPRETPAQPAEKKLSQPVKASPAQRSTTRETKPKASGKKETVIENRQHQASALGEDQNQQEARTRDADIVAPASTPESAKEEEARKNADVQTNDEKTDKNSYGWTTTEIKPAQKDVQINSYNAYSSQSGAAANAPLNYKISKSKKMALQPAETAYYEDGEEVLKKELKEKFAEKRLDQKFEATLFINKNGAVEKAEFTKPFDLNAQQQKQVIDILKTLSKFKFYSASKGKKLQEYNLVYQ